MKTLICQQPGVMEYVEKDIPTPADNEVLLKIKAVGICGTDIHAFAGRQPFFSYPRVLGHEICAEAVSRGSQCQTAQLGQRYSVIPCIPWRVRSLSGRENELLRTCFAVWRASGWGF